MSNDPWKDETAYFDSLTESEKKHYCIGFMRGMEFMENLRKATPEQILEWYKALQASGLGAGFVTQERIDELQAFVDRKNAAKNQKKGWFSTILSRII